MFFNSIFRLNIYVLSLKTYPFGTKCKLGPLKTDYKVGIISNKILVLTLSWVLDFLAHEYPSLKLSSNYLFHIGLVVPIRQKLE